MPHKPICLLTGASGGIGAAIAKLFDQQGYRLILQGRDEAKLLALNEQLSSQHRIVCGDLSDPQQRAIVMDTCFAEQENAPSVLINNAGIGQFKSFDQVSGADIDTLINTNLVATIDMTRLFLERVSCASTIFNVGSAFGSIGYPANTLYCASKFGLRGFTEALHRELIDSEHRICYFAPRATDTTINSDAVTQLNLTLGNASDSPDCVAQALLKMLQGKGVRKAVGWPEKLFARINGIFPEIVDNAITKQTQTILSFARGDKT